jgi:hypothetical protein
MGRETEAWPLRHAGCAGVEVKPEIRSQKSEVACADDFNRKGFEIFKGVIPSPRCDELATELSVRFQIKQGSNKSKIGGVRNLLQTTKLVAELAACTEFTDLFQTISGQNHFPVRAIFFDKTAETNWLVPWHQDLAIAVMERIETPGFGGWSIKDEVVHVHPPREILESMVTMRLHLDDCDAANGALKAVPESHQHGKLTSDEIIEWAKQPPFVCEVSKGDVLLMRPLLLHASSPTKNPSHRRILHIEYATQELPNGLQWLHH